MPVLSSTCGTVLYSTRLDHKLGPILKSYPLPNRKTIKIYKKQRGTNGV